MKLIKSILVTGLILLGCFETLQFFNRLDALSRGKNFLKAHNSTVESIDCEVPARAAFDGSVRFCTFNATPKQVQILIKNLNFRPINPRIRSEEELDRIYDELDKQAKNKGVVKLETRWEIDDMRRSSHIEENSCWAKLELKNRSELNLYGTYENNENKFRNNFFIFYKESTKKGCIRFESVGG